MGMIPIDVLETGMVLASDVQDRNGRLLLGAGSELNGKHLMIFRTWGVVEVDIEGVDDLGIDMQVSADISEEALDESRKALEELFMHSNLEHPFVQELMRIAATRKVLYELS